MKATTLLVVVLFGATCSAQTRVLTNADLTPHAVQWRVPPASPEMLASLAAHQFVWYPPVPPPQWVPPPTRQSNNMSGPWEWPRPTPRCRLDGTLLSQPATVYGLPPWGYVPQVPQPFYTAYAHPRSSRRPSQPTRHR